MLEKGSNRRSEYVKPIMLLISDNKWAILQTVSSLFIAPGYILQGKETPRLVIDCVGMCYFEFIS